MKLNCDYFVSSGHVGPPLPCNAVKLVDVVEMNYLAANGEGEVRSVFFSNNQIHSVGGKMYALALYLTNSTL